MGMGHVPFHAWTISHEQLELLVPDAWAEFQKQLESQNLQLKDIAFALRLEEPCCESEAASNAIQAALQRQCEAFQEATRVSDSHLELELTHYDPELGSRYDELETGANWLVSCVRQFTPSGEKFKDRLDYKGWTEFG